MNNFMIEKMKLTDLNELSMNLKIDFDNFWSIAILESELKNKKSKYYVLKIEEEIIGFGGFWESVDDVHLTNIVIKKAYRNKGFATVLLKHILLSAKNTKKNSITLEVNENNQIAKKLYLKHGFKILGIRKKYYNNKENAIIMTLKF